MESSLSSTGTTSDASPLPTSNAGPGILHPRSIATHVASLAQSMVSAPMVRASPGAWSQNRLCSFQSNSFECMRYGSASDVWMRQLEQCRPITEVEGQSIGNETNEHHAPSPTSRRYPQNMVLFRRKINLFNHGFSTCNVELDRILRWWGNPNTTCQS